jgi:hypothetical protein
MERIEFIICMVLLVWAIVELRRVNSKLNDSKKESERHNNIQKVILEQIDELNQKIG